MKFSVFAQNEKTFDNGFRSAMIGYGSRKFKKTIFVEENKIYSEGKKNGKVLLAEYKTPERAEEVKNELLSAYDKKQSDYFFPKE